MPRTVVPPFERLMLRVEKRADGCWQFTGQLSRDGYSRVWTGGARRMQEGHRVAYEALVGPVAPGLELDHLCRNRACVNPAHLEPVTHQVNLLRGQSPAAIKAQQTYCVNGHEFTPENTYANPRGGRECRACDAARARARRADPANTARIREQNRIATARYRAKKKVNAS